MGTDTMTFIARIEKWLFHPPTTGHPAILLVRLMAGGVFLSEGILKFVYPNQGVGRFTKLGFPLPLFTASFVGGLEIVGGIRLAPRTSFRASRPASPAPVTPTRGRLELGGRVHDLFEELGSGRA